MPYKSYISNSQINGLVKQYPVAKQERIKDSLWSEVKQWNNKVRRWLDKENPFHEDQHKFKMASRYLKQNNASIDDIEDDFLNFQLLLQKTKTEQPPAKAGGLVLRTESPDTGQIDPFSLRS